MERRPRCPVCERPQRTCLCPWVRPVAHRTEVLILQHPQEAHHAKNTARLLHLSLSRSHLLVGECWAESTLAQGGLAPLPTWLLYPGVGPQVRPGVAPATEQLSATEVEPGTEAGAGMVPVSAVHTLTDPPPLPSCRLVVLDATWRHSRSMLHRSPWLQGLPRWSLDHVPASRYAIRKAHQPGQLSTLEAVCEALARLEGDARRFQPLLVAFDGFVARHLAFRPAEDPMGS